MKLRLLFVLLSLALTPIALLTASPAAAALPEAARDSRWIRVVTPNFVCYSNADQWVVSGLMQDLERLREALSQTTRGFEKQSPVPNYFLVFRDLDSFDPYNPIPQDEEGTLIGFFSPGELAGVLALAVSSKGEARKVIYHEFVHSQLHTSLPGLPLWLNEGLAELYSTFKSKGLTAEIGRPIEDDVEWLEREPMFPLRTLLVITQDDTYYNHSQRKATFYAESWALTHMLAIPPQGRDRFSAFLQRIGEGSSGKAALDQTYGRASYDSLQTALQRYLEERSFQFRKLQFTENFEDVPVKTSAVERKEILVRLGDLQMRQQPARIREARDHYETALRLDASYAPAIVAQGASYEVMGEQTTADSLYQLAVQMDPARSEGLFYLGRSIARRSLAQGISQSKGTTPPTLREARDLLSKALELAPGHPEVLAAFGSTYLQDWGDSVAVGLWALQEASVHLPTRRDVLIELATLTAHAGNRPGATRIIEEQLVPLRDGAAVKVARRAVFEADVHFANELVRDGKTEEAVALMRHCTETSDDPEVKDRAEEMIAYLEGRAQRNTYNRFVNRYNLGVQALNQQDLTTASGHFEAVLAEAPDEELKREARARLVDIEFHLGMKRAGSLVQRGQIKQARVLLDSLRTLPIRSEQRALLTEFQEAIE